jgi:hypothetical protein
MMRAMRAEVHRQFFKMSLRIKYAKALRHASCTYFDDTSSEVTGGAGGAGGAGAGGAGTGTG